MPRDAEIDKLLRPGGKTIFGYGDEPAPAGGAAPVGSAAAGVTVPESLRTPPSYDEMDWQQKMGQGVGKGLAGLATSAGRLGAHVVPQGVSDFVAQHGGQRLADYANAPSEGPLETAGSAMAQGAALMMGPGELKLGDLARANVGRVVNPAIFRGGGRGFTVNPAFRTARKFAKAGGDIAETAGRGAAGGALADPENPGAGALAGAAGGFAGPAAGAALRSPLGRYAGSLAATEGAMYGIHAATGMPFHPIVGPMIVWHGSPIGRTLRRYGDRIVDQLGRTIGRVVTPQAGGYIAGNPAVRGPASEAAGSVMESIPGVQQ